MAAFFCPLANVAWAMAVFSAACRSLSAFRTDSMEMMSSRGGSRSLISARTISMPQLSVCSSSASLRFVVDYGSGGVGYRHVHAADDVSEYGAGEGVDLGCEAC